MLKYLKTQLKRNIKLLPMALLSSAVIFACIIGGALLLSNNKSEDDAKTKIRLGIVGETENDFLGVGVGLLSKMDYSKYALDFDYMTLPEAKRLLENGNIKAYILIPDGFVEDMYYGRDAKLKYVSTYSSGIGMTLTNEFVGIASDFVSGCEDVIYGYLRLASSNDGDIYEIYETSDDRTNEILLKQVELILRRNRVFQKEYVGVSNNLSMEGCFFVGLSMLFVLLMGITYSHFFVNRKRALLKMLTVRGVNPFLQILSEFISYAAVSLPFVLIALNVSMYVFGYELSAVEELVKLSVPEIFVLSLKLILPVLLLLLISLCLYEVNDSVVGGMLLQLVSILLVGFFSGLIYPVSFLPRTVRWFSEYNPIGASVRLASDMVCGNFNAMNLCVVILWMVVLFCISAFLRKKVTKCG